MFIRLRILLCFCALCPGSALAGCTFDLSSVPAREAEERSPDAGPGPGDASTPAVDGEVSNDDTPAKHRACDMPAPAMLPPEPFVASDARGRPTFDYWRELACDDPAVSAYPTCDEYAGSYPENCELCAGESGLCQANYYDLLDHRCAPLVSAEPLCTTCVPLEAKRKACCLGSDTFCEPWPYRGAAQLGYPCAVHADCSPGLLCVTPEPVEGSYPGPYGFGLCTCPGVEYQRTMCSTYRVSE